MGDIIPTATLLELSNLEQDALLDLYDVDISDIAGEKTIFRFHSGTNGIRKPIIWQGNTYEPYPISVTGFEKSGQGVSNRPVMVLANISGLLTSLVAEYDELLGAIVTRRQVYAKFLDAVNFPEGNPRAMPEQEIISCYVIEKMTGLTRESASFELALPCEADGALLPARTITAHTCCWKYRSSECSYTGGAVADEADRPTSDLALDKCSKSLTGCKLRFGKHSILPIGCFPSSAKLG